ncbi:hypothetical protein V6N13_104754 [Hibiscus sabdariffa]
MVFSLSWRRIRWWCVYYAWCMLRALLGLPLRPGAIRGGASFVWLASCPRDSLGSPRLEAELPPLRLGFSFGNPWLGMALSVRGLFPTSVALHAWCIGPLGYTDYGCAGRYPGCCFGPLVWHRLWAPWAWPWMLPWPPNNSVACCTSSRLYISLTILAGPLVVLASLCTVQCPRCFAAAARMLAPSTGCALC